MSKHGTIRVGKGYPSEDLRYFREIVPGIYGQLLDQFPALAPRTALVLGMALDVEAVCAKWEGETAPGVCLDGGFAGNDQIKANAMQIFKTKGVTSFKMV